MIRVRIYVKDGWLYVYNKAETEPCIALKHDFVGTGIGLRAVGGTAMVFSDVLQYGHGDHSYSDWVQTKAPSCEEKGEQQRSCGGCGDVETEEIAAKGHGEGTWVRTKEPTTKEAGLEELRCECGHVLDTRTIDPLPEKGCGGSLAGGAVAGATAMLAGAAMLALKKKKEDE